MTTPGPWYVPNPQWFGIRSRVTDQWVPATADNAALMAAAPELRAVIERLLSGDIYARADAIALLEALPK